MIDYISQHQLKCKQFGSFHQISLNEENRWIKLAKHFPWDECISIFIRKFPERGRKMVNPRLIIGSLIIKHKLDLSDEETVMIIEENPYMQYFLGLDEFAPRPLFSPSLFVEWRKKLGNDIFNEFAEILYNICNADGPAGSGQTQNKGKMKLDATVADQNIKYPNDLDLLNKARERTEKIVDLLFDELRGEIEVKPRTYRKVARKKYLTESKKRQKNKKALRSCIRYQLNCLDRNIRNINEMLDKFEHFPLSGKTLWYFYVVQKLNDQQREMYNERSNHCDDRIVSLDQPWVRPIVRGKSGKKVEFGTKMGVVHTDGFAKAETLSWDAYNEGADLIPHVEAYKKLRGHYPELVQVDKIYGTNKNRKWCQQRGIRMTVSKKGKKPELNQYQKRKRRDEFNERNQIEGKFGQAKQGYGLNNIKAKLKDTSHSWIGTVLFITNIIKFAELSGFSF